MKGTIKDKYLESLKIKDLAQTLRFKAHENFALKEGSVSPISVVDFCLCVPSHIVAQVLHQTLEKLMNESKCVRELRKPQKFMKKNSKQRILSDCLLLPTGRGGVGYEVPGLLLGQGLRSSSPC